GVRLCRARESALKAWVDLSPLGDLTAQALIEGMPAQCSFAAWRGRYLAGLTALKWRTHPGAKGPTSVAAFRAMPGLESACARVAEALGMSGLASVDFVIEEESGLPWAIELNPRPTPIVHLGARLGRDLALALREAIAGRFTSQEPLREATIALYPRERMRDPDSEWVGGPDEDVPWDDPTLLARLAEAISVR
ncbi:MAG: hypothetical protein H7X93_12820, partial [Sphingomonadaceae bacterium]|nr:hypothetical protein [Sphingomonadaceae bacterium]